MLGDAVHDALARVGVTPESVERWLGAPCGCEERREKLNRLDSWVRMSARSGTDRARGWILGIIRPSPPGDES